MTLAHYLESATRHRWQFGIWDCCTFMANWLMENGLPDPMADRRGAYATRREYRAMLKSEGGMVEACLTRFAAIGLRETNSPHAGDVAIVMTPFAIRYGRPLYAPTGAICTSQAQRAVIATDVALAIAPVPTLRVWALG